MSTPKKVVINPIIIRNINRKMVLAPQGMTPSLILSNLKVAKMPMFHEDVIYESSNCDFLKGESQQVLIVNKVNIASKTCRTIAKCTAKGVSVETTSDDICSLIGQNNYDTVLSALGSVFNEETKVRGILALLRKQTKYRTTSTQTDMDICRLKKESVDSSCQTLESNLEILEKQKQRKRIRRQQYAPYVVKEVKKCVINIDHAVKKEDVKKEIKEEQKKKDPDLRDIKDYVDEDSNISCESTGNISSLSFPHLPDFLEEQKVKDILNSIQNTTCTLNAQITVYDGTNIMLPVKPEDEFHIATPDILKNVSPAQRRKLLTHQALIDFKTCLVKNEDGYYPIHIAVLHNDTDLIRRQCLALRSRHESVDKPGAGDLTALQMAIQHNSSVACTRELLRGGADLLLGGAERRSALHLAAAAAQPAHLRALLDHCDACPREVIKNNQDFWKPELEDMPVKDVVKYLNGKIGELFDEQGNTPLMAAAGFGRADAVALLVARAPHLVDTASPACGATAFYRAVAAVCLHAKETGTRTAIPAPYLKIAEVLVGHGADLTVENHSGSSVNSLLQEFNLPPLSMVIANKMSSMKHGSLATSMILVKDKEGRIAHQQLKPRNQKTFESAFELARKIVAIADIGSKRKQDTATDINSKAAKTLKTDTDVKNDANSCKVQPDKIARLKIIPTKNSQSKSTQAKPSGNKSKIVIVENVSVNTNFSKMIIPTAPPVYSKPKDIVLVSTKKRSEVCKKIINN